MTYPVPRVDRHEPLHALVVAFAALATVALFALALTIWPRVSRSPERLALLVAAGHVETGEDSVSDPLMGGLV